MPNNTTTMIDVVWIC